MAKKTKPKSKVIAKPLSSFVVVSYVQDEGGGYTPLFLPVKAETIEDVIEAMNNGDNSINGCQLPPEDCFFINDDCADVQGEILTLQDWADRSWDLTY